RGVWDTPGRADAEWLPPRGEPVLAESEKVRLVVRPERCTHAGKIEARFAAMLAAGALEEVRGLLALGLSEELPIMRALGVAPLAAWIAGKLERSHALARPTP